MSEIHLPTPFKVGSTELAVLSFMVKENDVAPFYLIDIAKGTRLPGGNVHPVLEKYIDLEFIQAQDSDLTYKNPHNGIITPRRIFRLTEPGVQGALQIVTGYFLPASPNNSISYIRS